MFARHSVEPGPLCLRPQLRTEAFEAWRSPVHDQAHALRLRVADETILLTLFLLSPACDASATLRCRARDRGDVLAADVGGRRLRVQWAAPPPV